MQADVYVGYNAEFYFSGESIRSEKTGTPADLVSDHLISWGRKNHLSGGVRAGTRAVAPTTRRSGARAAACWGSPPWGAGPEKTYIFS